MNNYGKVRIFKITILSENFTSIILAGVGVDRVSMWLGWLS